VAADWTPYILRFKILGAWIWRLDAWILDARGWRDWRQVAAGSEEGIGRNSHTLELELEKMNSEI
jgi:hypothetical protein